MVLLILQVVVAVIIIVFINIIIIAITVFKTKNLFDAISFWFFIGASVNYLLLKPYRHRVGSFNVDRVKNQIGSHTSYLISNIKNISKLRSMLLEEYIDVLKEICWVKVLTKLILKILALVCYIFLLKFYSCHLWGW